MIDYFQVSKVTILEMLDGHTLNIFAISGWEKRFEEWSLRIFETILRVNLKCFAVSGIFPFLPFRFLSLEFEIGSPKNRWSGLTHFGLSQMWQMKASLGMGPK